MNINSKELSKLGDNSSNANSTNKTITNEPNSPLKKSTQSNLFILDKAIKNKKIIKGDYLIIHSSCIDGLGDEAMEIPKSLGFDMRRFSVSGRKRWSLRRLDFISKRMSKLI